TDLNDIALQNPNKLWVVGNHSTIMKYDMPIGIVKTGGNIPDRFNLFQNYPNPFNPETKIKFQVPELSNIKIIVFDLLGREVESLVNEKLTPGTYEVNWNAEEVPSGVYFCRMMTENYSQTIKLALIK
ncbi:MAG: T9SS type A sorting domain-containing protein, partial [Ignavibacteria bacterium]|nr:T9SS type A sorting domain-containing protein [Ignavibacteria bacterium]